MTTSVRGACLCGAVTFTIAPPYRWFAHCHCSMCRKHYGTLFGTSLGVMRAKFRWLAGADEIVHYRATAAFERLESDPRYVGLPRRVGLRHR